jgi:hypothetical protein
MKKLLVSLVLTLLLAGCSGGFTASDQSYLDEKIKCKKLAEERIEKVQSLNIGIADVKNKLSSYSVELDSCFLYYQKTYFHNNEIDYKIENTITGEEVARADANEINENFNEKLKLYFGEDAE